MIDIDKIKDEIVECLLPLEPEKVILFGSYADGTANEDSDIDLFLIKKDGKTGYDIDAAYALRGLVRKYKVGFDTFSATQGFLDLREGCFYDEDVLEKGRVLYG
ncbi:putative nucleotidyltransferase [Limihaloglobus sulfuriphilus]|uniref:Putative nucleotidyltransferase n=1 Tax=Limihaloglobus sulfuriphilus TaxID=1851148 RepID=A0A1Q2MGS9_9BACT|nr:nucleotidyltransferase domain-containing protein [Limihaloglobus sulfuriphilus]AQQ71517.1 putative nucleotidyltransferase [Limihaloglobus sulfuriphilus]